MTILDRILLIGHINAVKIIDDFHDYMDSKGHKMNNIGNACYYHPKVKYLEGGGFALCGRCYKKAFELHDKKHDIIAILNQE